MAPTNGLKRLFSLTINLLNENTMFTKQDWRRHFSSSWNNHVFRLNYVASLNNKQQLKIGVL